MAKQAKNNDTGAVVEDPDDIVRIVAGRLQDARLRAGLTQVQLGERANLKQSYIFELEYGSTNITLRTLEKMAKALDVDMRDLLPGSPLAPPSPADLQQISARLDQMVGVAEAQLKVFNDFRASVRAFSASLQLKSKSGKDE